MLPRVDRNLVRLVVALVAVMVVAGVQRRSGREEGRSFAVTVVATVVAPFQRAITAVVYPVRDAWAVVRDLRSLYSENQRLRSEVERLRQRVNTLNERGLENQRLREMLRFRETLPNGGESALPATVIGARPTNRFNTVTIDRGERDGVRVRQVVLTPRGLVGQVHAVTPHTATVLLVTDALSGVGGRVQRTGWRGVVRGTGGPLLEMYYLPKEADVRPGDLVVTSGVGSVFRVKGTVIGRVEDVRLDESTSVKTATVRPAVDLHRLEEVFVLTQ